MTNPLARLRPFVIIPLALASLGGAVPNASSDPRMETWPFSRAGFGGAVGVGQGDILVGEPFSATRPGAVAVYRKDAQGRWAEAARLTAAGGSIADGFGWSLDVDGGRMIVGGLTEGGAAAAWIFERSAAGAWSQVARLDGPEGLNLFGFSVALSGDRALVGAPIEGGFGVEGRPGAVHAYSRGGTGTWSHDGRITASDAVPDGRFGFSLALDGPDAIVASAAQGAYALRLEDDGWRESGKLAVDGDPAEQFGTAVAISGGSSVVGVPTGAVFGFQLDPVGGEWTPSGQLAAPDSSARFFGGWLALDAGGLWVSAPGATGGAAVYGFRRDDRTGSWLEVARLQSSGLSSEEPYVPSGLAVSGGVAVVGLGGADLGAGRAAIFESGPGAAWTESGSVASAAVEGFDPVLGEEVECTGTASVFGCNNVDLVAFLPISAIGGARGVDLSGIWGWTDPQTGREYALVARTDGAAIVDISEPVNPIYVAEVPRTPGANPSSWREIKVYEDHAYIVSDGAGDHGMQIVDLTRLRAYSGTTLELAPDTTYHGVASAHNIVINEESGLAVATGGAMGGETCGGGLHMIDIREPKDPKFAGCFADPLTGMSGTGYTHDAQCVTYRGPDPDYGGREICIGSNETALSVADVTDRANPKAVSRAGYPNVAYTHQGWFTEDQRYFFVNDELDELSGTVANTRTLVWDLEDLDDPVVAKEFMGPTKASDHNLYIKGNLMYQSNYNAGLRVIDVSDPLNPVELGFLDTQPAGPDNPGFSGTWSNYPFFDSGVIAVSGIEQGLFLVRYRPKLVG